MALLLTRKDCETSYQRRQAQRESPSELSPLPRAQRDERLTYFAESRHISECIQTYLPHAFSESFEDHHLVEIQCLQIRGELVVVILPRGFGKTTIADGYTFYSVAYGLDPYIVRFEHDLTIGQIQIQNLVKAFTANPRVMADFQIEPGPIWRPKQGELSFLNHNSHAKHKEIYVRYVGVQSMARGTTYDFSRISLAIFNDVVKGQAEAVSQAWNEKVYSIVKKDVGMAGGSYRKQPISIIFVTTIQASGDVSDRLANDLASLVYKVPAIEGDDADIREFVQFVSDDIPNIKALVESIRGVPPNLTGKQVTSDDHKRYCDSRSEYQEWFQKLQSKWSAEYPMWDFVFEIFAHGSETFLQERQHITGDEQFRRFRVKWFQPYKEQPLSSGSEVRYAMTVDWSGQPKEGNDPRAIYCGAYHRETEDLYTLGVWCDIATDEETFEKIYEMFWMCFPWYAGEGVTVYMEDIIAATGISKSYIETMRQKKILEGSDPNYYIQLPIKLFNTKVVRGDKLVAISALRPYAEQGHIWYIPGHTHQGLMLDQFKHYEGKHTHSIRDIRRKIDIPDTVSMFYFTVIRRGPSRRPVILTSSPKEPPKPQQRPPVSLTSPAKSGRRKMLTPS